MARLPRVSANPASTIPAVGRPRRTMRGSTLTGFVVGLIVGLAAAVVVALLITQGTAPFVDRAGRAPERSLEPSTPDQAPDPNAPLYSKNRPAAEQVPAAEAPRPAEERMSILERLFGRRAADTTDEKPVAKPPAKPASADRAPAKPAAPIEARTGEADRGGYLLQVGAFRSADEADAMRARLALVGFEARMMSAEVNGQPIQRVRVGPFASLDEMNRARARLAENGIEASVVRQK